MPRQNFVCLDGTDGGGKSGQAAALAQTLRNDGYDVILTREPGGTPLAERLRAMLLNRENCSITPAHEALIFAAARADHMHNVIRPALNAGKIVICDRFALSTRVYQGSRGISDHDLDELDEIAFGLDGPGTTIILDVPEDISIARTAARRGDNPPDYFERQRSKVRTFREAFLAIAQQQPNHCIVIDASGDFKAVQNEIETVVRGRLGL